MAGTTRLELATSAVTGQRSNQLNYVPSCVSLGLLEPRERLSSFSTASISHPVPLISGVNGRHTLQSICPCPASKIVTENVGICLMLAVEIVPDVWISNSPENLVLTR
jgi:hypothetical protein